MKKTYTACLILAMSSILYYGTLTGSSSNVCTRGRYTALTNNPNSCSAGCHGGSVVNNGTDTSSLTGTNDTTTQNQAGPSGLFDIAFREGLAAYPTLSSDIVNIMTSKGGQDLQFGIYSLDGRSMMSGTLPSYPALTTLDIHGLTPAHYIVRVTDETHAASFRIIKQ